MNKKRMCFNILLTVISALFLCACITTPPTSNNETEEEIKEETVEEEIAETEEEKVEANEEDKEGDDEDKKKEETKKKDNKDKKKKVSYYQIFTDTDNTLYLYKEEEYDEVGSMIKSSSQTDIINPRPETMKVTEYEYEYDSNDNYISKKTTVDGQVTVISKFQRDEDGHITSQEDYDESGNLKQSITTIYTDGQIVEKITKDSEGNEIKKEITEYVSDGSKKTIYTNGSISGYEETTTEKADGRRTATNNIYNANNELTGYSIWVWDEYEHLIETTMNNPIGHETKNVYVYSDGSDGQIVETTYYINGELINSVVMTAFTDNGDVLSEDCIINGKVDSTTDFTYDEKGRLIETYTHDSKGGNFSRQVFEYFD